MNLNDLRAGVIASLAKTLENSISVTAHGGRFGLDEIKRYGACAPAVLVAVIGIGSLTPQGSDTVADVSCAALIVTSDRAGVSRDAGALAIVSTLAPGISGCSFDLDVSGATNVRGDNLYSGAIDQLGVALWAISWRQPGVTLTAMAPADLAEFLTLHIDYPGDGGQTVDIRT